jgi:integrase
VARGVTGTLYESPKGSARWHAKFTTTRGRRSVRLWACRTLEEADARKVFIAKQLDRLRAADRMAVADRVLERAAGADDTASLDEVRREVDAIVTGTTTEPWSFAARGDRTATFRQFAEQWTTGALRKQYPDHVAEKRSVSDDVYRLNAHVLPLVGDVPLQEFTSDHAESVMRSLPEERSAGTRRHVAQLLSRILRLAVYPARILDKSPIPEGFLPKPSSLKAVAWLYPEEERALLSDVRVPLLHRVFYGVIAREGLRKGEAGALTWADVDLERGSIRLDENKTDEPRAWALGRDVLAALRAWKALAEPRAEVGFPIFSQNGNRIGIDHLAITFRGHLSGIQGVRAALFEKGPNRRPIRVHDLRATFVTLALAAGRTETWVADRTGHKSSSMINTYRRAARTAEELDLGWLAPLDQAIPELRAIVCEMSAPGPNGAPRALGPNPNARPGHVSRPLATAEPPLGSSAARRAGSTPVSRTTSPSARGARRAPWRALAARRQRF